MKRIFIPFFAAAALLASCSDWTEAEHKDFLPPMNQNDPAFLTSLRDFKVGEHLVTMMIVRGTSTAPNRQNQHPMYMPVWDWKRENISCSLHIVKRILIQRRTSYLSLRQSTRLQRSTICRSYIPVTQEAERDWKHPVFSWINVSFSMNR